MLLLVLLTWPHSPAVAQETVPPRVVDLEIGIAGYYRLGQWTPLQVTILGGSRRLVGELVVTTPDADGTPCRYVAPQPIQVLPGQTTHSLVYVRVGNSQPQLTIDLVVDGRRALRHTQDWASSALDDPLASWAPIKSLLVASVGNLPALRQLEEQQIDEQHALELAAVERLEQLPTRWYGYESFDAVLITGDRVDMLSRFTRDNPQHQALARWVELGGRLILCVGSQAEGLIGPGGPLSDLAPGRLAEMVELPSTQAIEIYSGAEERIPRLPANRRLRVARLEGISGRVEVSQGELPLIVRAPRGLGEVVFVAFDLGESPFADWPGSEKLLQRLLFGEAAQAPVDPNQYYWTPYEDLAGQLRVALDHFRGVRIVPFALVAMLVLGYILLIGPFDFFLVRNVLKRMELTWITFPLMVVLVSAAAYFGSYWSKGTALRLNQVDVIDVDVAGRLVRGTTWLNLFSPQSRSYTLSVEPSALAWPTEPGSDEQDSAALLGWFGVPGSTYGGMESGNSTSSLFSRPYQFTPRLDAALGVPIQVWSSKSFISRWTRSGAPANMANLTVDASGKLNGEVVNPLDCPLSQCLLLCGDWAYNLETLAAGERATIESTDSPRSLQTALRQYSGNGQQEQATYSSGGQVDGVVPQMLFQQAKGGTQYSQHLNRYQGYLDLSGHVEMGRAVLLGRARQQPPARLLHDGQPLDTEHLHGWVYYRFVLTVAETPPADE